MPSKKTSQGSCAQIICNYVAPNYQEGNYYSSIVCPAVDVDPLQSSFAISLVDAVLKLDDINDYRSTNPKVRQWIHYKILANHVGSEQPEPTTHRRQRWQKDKSTKQLNTRRTFIAECGN